MPTASTDPTPQCLLCQLPSDDIDRKVGDFTYYRCAKCGGVFVHPLRPQSFYLENETYLDDMELYMSRIDPYGQRWMIEQCERLLAAKLTPLQRGKFFEIGAGVGYLTLMALARGWQAQGIETSQQAVDYARKLLKVDVTLSTIEKYETAKTFDVIALVEVLEHFVDPLKAFESIRKLCGERTFIFGTTPNTGSLHWQESEQDIYQPQDHIFLFNEKSIRYFAAKAGIQDLTVELFGSGAEHDSNLMYAGLMSA